MKIGLGKATGKIILIGEHAVVYGQPAIAIPFLATKVLVDVKKNGDETFDYVESLYYDGPLHLAPSSLENIAAVVAGAKKELGITAGLWLTIESSIPPERGMGSSAAVVNAVIRAIFSWADVSIDAKKLTEIANFGEHIAHGNPSGIDQATTADTRPIYFVKGQYFQPFSLHVDGFLIVADSNLKGRTKEAVSDVATLLKNEPEKKILLEQLGQATEEMKIALINNQLESIGQLMNQAQKILQQLTVSNDTLDAMIALGLNAGALGGKLTGGGRGGCVIFVSPTIKEALKIQAALQNSGYKTWIQDLRELNK
ncbi:mevalonate kinase [Enterococcus timonensis]|uniref:mevalonate kinase n=1 Tax=Enterococcus timonensis TaxID=1852364 RepID=UPI0008DA2CB9|nr:mevalonate kinase [Enterococcus timonensis]